MNITTQELVGQITSLHSHGVITEIRDSIPAHTHSSVDPPLLVALMSRETNCINEVGDGGHGRGIVQIDDRSWHEWLHAHAGCKSGKFKPSKGHTAADPGYVPTVGSAIVLACQILTTNIAYAKAHGVPSGKRLKFALSAYNAGCGGAANGYHSQDDSDAYTAGHDYAADVMARAKVAAKHL